MNANNKKIGIFLTIVFLCVAVFTGMAYSADGKVAESTHPNQQLSPKKFKIKLGPPPETSPTSVKSSTGPSVEMIPVKTKSKSPIKIMPQQSSEIMFVLDNSGSMKKNDPDRITKEVVTNFIRNAVIGSRIGMVIFGKDARILEPITEITESTTRIKLINSLEQLDYRGQLTNTPAGIERAIYALKTSEEESVEKAIILLTDGIIDTGDKTRDVEEETWLKEQLALECRDLGIKIYGIAFTDKADFRLMQILASKTNGEYFRIYKAEEIQSVFNRINERIAHTAAKKDVSAQDDSKSEAKPKTEVTQQASQIPPQKITLRTEPPKSTSTAQDTPVVQKRKLGDIILILVLAAIILAVLIFFLMMYRTNRRDDRQVLLGKKTGGDPSQKLRPDIQAELIDVEHIIPQDSVSLTIDKASISIGRDSSNDIIIPEKVVSSLHATIEYRNGYYYLEDNRSTNGTRLNNRRVEQDTKMKLKSGDIIHFAKSEFRFLIHDQAPYGETMVIDTSEIQS
jgi:Mg-chelatase subunit ChlD